MSDKDKDQVTEDGSVELNEDQLEDVQGGAKYLDMNEAKGITLDNGIKWKVNGFDGKGNDVMKEDISRVTKVFPKVE